MSNNNNIGFMPRLGTLGVVAIFGMVLLTIYMAFAFPYGLFHLKQSETTEIKSVILVARAGERIPSPESYFIGEETPEELLTLGYDQLTNAGKERMFLLGKFLKLRYYHLLLNGNPRLVHARSSDADKCLESTQALLAGLNPPKDSWLWSTTNELSGWQPKAIHTTPSGFDDLLSAESNCFRMEEDKKLWKNSTRYQQLLSEFRHDLQTLRANTGLEFEDDLEMLCNIDEALKSRKAFREDTPSWYTSTFASRLAHIASVTTESRYSTVQAQRLYVGRLLHEITQNINVKIHAQYQNGGGLLWGSLSPQGQQQPSRSGQKRNQIEPNVYIYMTHKHRLSALLNSLQIYTSQPYYGTSLLIELHYDPINETYFLRLFTLSPTSAYMLPEPLRVNPVACQDSAECSPQQFEQNIRHLLLDRSSWNEVCLNRYEPTTTPRPLEPLMDYGNTRVPILPQPQQYTTVRPTEGPITESSQNSAATTVSELEKLDESLIVGPGGNNLQPNSVPTYTTSPTLVPTSEKGQDELTTTSEDGKPAIDNTTPLVETTTLAKETPTTSAARDDPSGQTSVISDVSTQETMIN